MATKNYIPKECIECGHEFTPGKRNYERARCCSVKCNNKANYRSNVVCTCAYCGKTFKKLRQALGIYCSNECARSARRNETLRLHIGEHTALDWHECRVCGDVLSQRPGAGKVACKSCVEEFGYFASHNSPSEFLLAKRAGGRICTVCGNGFMPYRGQSVVCSIECHTQTDEYKRQAALYRKTPKAKRRKRIENAARRARKRFKRVGRIDPIAVFDRDRWRCYICNQYTPKSLRGTYDGRAPEMDHVIPLSVGGTHTLDNVKCCCRSCNGEKGARIYQTDMFVGAQT